MSLMPKRTEIAIRPRLAGGWCVGIRTAVCGLAALLNALDLGFQGNGNLIWSGVFLGFALGFAWSALLLFGIPSVAQGLRTSVRVALWGASLFATLAIFVVICFHIWGK